MKNGIKVVLQMAFGYQRYLRIFAWIKARTLHWDRRERDFFHFLQWVPRDGVVLDIGANLGFICVQLARRASLGRVIAFEPLPDNHSVLQWLLRRFCIGNVEVYPWALGDRNGTVSMVLPVHGKARQQGLGHVESVGQPDEHGIHFDVPLRRLDDLPQVNGAWTRVSAIKMDVENFEQFVLQGATRLLERDRPLVYLELWDNENRKACFDIAARFDYRVMVCVDGELVPFDPKRHRHGNFFFVPRPGTEAKPVPARERVHEMPAVVSMQPARAECTGPGAIVSKFPQALGPSEV